MDIQRQGTTQSHNMLLTTILPSLQIKHLTYCLLDAPKIIIHQQTELKFITGLVAATQQNIQLYAIYQAAHAFQMGEWRVHQDIVNINAWDRTIVVNIGHRVVGLRYQSGFLKNSFMLSLQFLPLQPGDKCRVYPDRLGHFMVVQMRNYLLLCIGEGGVRRYKSRVVQKGRVQLVGDEVYWNQPNKPHQLVDIVKINLVEHQIGRVFRVQVVEQIVYLTVEKNNVRTLMYIPIAHFFNTIEQSPVLAMPSRDQLPSHCIPWLASVRGYKQPETLYHNVVENSLAYKTPQQITYQAAVFESPIRTLHLSQGVFPVVVWEGEPMRLSLLDKQKTYQDTYEFNKTVLSEGFCAEKVIYRQGLLTMASRTELIIVTSEGQRQTLHTGLGNILDFHVGSSILLIDNYQRRLTRLYQLSKGPKSYPYLLLTHKKKMFLESQKGLIGLYTVEISGAGELLMFKRSSEKGVVYNLNKEAADTFETVLWQVLDYQLMGVNGQKLMLCRTAEGTKLVKGREGELVSEDIEWDKWTGKRWPVGQYLASWQDNQLQFYHLPTQRNIPFTLSFQREGRKLVKTFMHHRRISTDRTTRLQELMLAYLVYDNSIEIWMLNLEKGEPQMVHMSSNIVEGPPVLSNELAHPDSYLTDKYRSLTCPEYVLSQHATRNIPESKASIVAAHLQEEDNKILLLLVTSQDQLFIYRKYFSLEDGGMILRRIPTPLVIVRQFKWQQDKAFTILGEGVITVGNFLLYKGELVESLKGQTHEQTRSLFRMDDKTWGLLSTPNEPIKIRQVRLDNDVIENFCLKRVECSLESDMMGILTSSEFSGVYSRKGFELFGKDLESVWSHKMRNETIICANMYQHMLAVSYYDYYCDKEGVADYNSVKFRFRIYNCSTKQRLLQRQKPLDEPILHIHFLSNDRVLLVTSSLVFVNIIKPVDKTLELFRTHNFTSKRTFLTSFAYSPQIAPSQNSGGAPGFMLFGGSHGGLSFYMGRWLEKDQLKELWFEGLRCGIRHLSLFKYGEESQWKGLVVDEDGNLIVMALQPTQAKKIADIRVGSTVNSVKVKSRMIYCSQTDGSIKLLTAAKLDNSEVSYLDFQQYFCQEMPFIGGFNLRSSRQMQQRYRSSQLVSKGNILDGDILQSFFSMTHTLRSHVIRQSQMQYKSLKSILPI